MHLQINYQFPVEFLIKNDITIIKNKSIPDELFEIETFSNNISENRQYDKWVDGLYLEQPKGHNWFASTLLQSIVTIVNQKFLYTKNRKNSQKKGIINSTLMLNLPENTNITENLVQTLLWENMNELYSADGESNQIADITIKDNCYELYFKVLEVPSNITYNVLVV